MDPNQQYQPGQQPVPPQQYQPQPQVPVQSQQPQQPVPGQLFSAPFVPPAPMSPVVMPQNLPDGQVKAVKKPLNKTLLAIAGVAILELLLIIALLAAVSSKPKATTSSAKATDSSQSSDNASSTNVQQTDDLISQDISGLSEQQDFSADTLSNTSLSQ